MVCKFPFRKIYPGDEKRSGIYECSPSTHGIWDRMRDLMHDSERRGYLCRGRKPMQLSYIAAWCGVSEEALLAAITELFSIQIPGRTRDEIIFDPAMVKEETLRKQRINSGLKGGNPVLLKQKVKQGVKQDAYPNTEYDNEVVVKFFQEVWFKYPAKGRLGKSRAFERFKASFKPVDKDSFHRALANYCASERVKGGFIQNASTWFGNWRDWIDYRESDQRREDERDKKQRWLAQGLSDCHGKPWEQAIDGKLRCKECNVSK